MLEIERRCLWVDDTVDFAFAPVYPGYTKLNFAYYTLYEMLGRLTLIVIHMYIKIIDTID